MTFLQPILLWCAAGIGVPIVIHLLSRYRTPVMQWAAMELLRKAVTTRSRRVRLEDILLLVLRCLAILLLALAIARPVIPSFFSAKTSGGALGTVIALDASFSMNYQAGVSTRFDRGVKLVRDVLKNVTPGTRLTVLLMGRRPRLLYRSINCNPQEVAGLLGKAEVLPEPLALESNLDAVLNALRDMDVPDRECYLVSDAQKQSWADPSQEARTRVSDMAGLGRVFLLPCGDDGKENLAITDLRALSGHLIKGEMVRVLAEVANTGEQKQDGVRVQLAIEGSVVDEKTVSVPPRQTVPVFLYARLKSSGPLRATARITEDPLATDNTRYAVFHVRDALRILCVDGQVAVGRASLPAEAKQAGTEARATSDSRYLAVALAPGKAKNASRGLSVDCISRTQLGSVRLFDYQVVILANVPELPAPLLETLHDYVAWGGGLIFFAGDLINARLANLSFGKVGLLPGELSAPIGDVIKQDNALALEVSPTGGALSQNLRALPKELLSEPLFYRRFPITLAPGVREILRFETGVAPASVPAGRDAGATLLAERDVGQGKVLFFNCTADEQWTNLPKSMFFPVLLHQAVTELTQQQSERPYIVGETISARLPADFAGDQALLTDPKGEPTTLKTFQGEGRRMVSVAKTDLPGIYTIEAVARASLPANERKAAGTEARPTAATRLPVNVDVRESAVGCLQGESLTAALRGLPLQIVEGDPSALTQSLQTARTGVPLWRPMLYAAIAAFLIEFLLAHWFSRMKVVETISGFSINQELRAKSQEQLSEQRKP
ncbi:MAG TPA: BatA domain-containing protein [Planctomycetota bacterium]|jgi:hypothetical protein